MNAETMIDEALTGARARGVTLRRGAIFDWTRPGKPGPPDWGHPVWSDTPTACNALGAVLLMHGKEMLVRDGFQPGWLDVLCGILGAEWWWLWRFSMGFDVNYQITFIVTKEGKDREVLDPVSKIGIRVARKHGVHG